MRIEKATGESAIKYREDLPSFFRRNLFLVLKKTPCLTKLKYSKVGATNLYCVILKLYKDKRQALVDEMGLYGDWEESEYEEFDFEGMVDSASVRHG